mmetsp:Transcript_14867/g.23524  ORF Transcript_14867/g.23524 Transcript_14867/m.23524 type:complete len:603 (+) Transcript_14867:105-1913(+)
MMPLYNISRGIHFQGVPRGVYSASMASMDMPHGRLPGSEDCSDDDTDGGYDSVRSVPSISDDRYDAYNTDPEYMDGYLHSDIGRQEVGGSTDSEGDARSHASSRSRLASPQLGSRLMDMGIFDLEFSEPPDLIGEDHTDDDSQPDTDSDGELSGMNSDDDDDDDYGLLSEVTHPPQLATVPEDRLQKVWTLGDESFNIFLCPITHEVMTDPVVSADGYTYERSAIARWFETSRKSPVTGQTLPHIDLVPNQSIRTLIKTLIDMTDDSEKQSIIAEQTSGKKLAADVAAVAPPLEEPREEQRLSAVAPVSSPFGLSAPSPVSTSVPSFSSTSVVSTSSVAQSTSSDAVPFVRRRATGEGRLESLPLGDTFPPAPTTVPSDGRQNLTQLSSTSEINSRRSRSLYIQAEATAAALVGNTTNAQVGSLSPGLRRQQRAHTTQLVDGASPISPQPLRGHSVANACPRPSSQPQQHSQPFADSGHGGHPSRPQSSSGCTQHITQAPSTALPPLRTGHTLTRSSPEPLPPEPTGIRGTSPPVVVPPISNRSPLHGRLPAQAPFPLLSEGAEVSNACGQRHGIDESPISATDAIGYGIQRRSDNSIDADL